MKTIIKNAAKKCSLSLSICFLFLFMLVIFGPSEIFFSNNTEFHFIYTDFINNTIVITLVISILYGLLAALLPDVIWRCINSVILGISIAGYIQIMFLNRNLELMGLSAEGFSATSSDMVINLIIWLIIIGLFTFLSLRFKKDSVSGFITFALIFIQSVALVGLIMGADESCYKYPNTEYHLSGQEQYTLSENDNIVVFILDCFSNLELDNAIATDPACIAPYKDFTRYNNGDCVYFGTFPSLTHMFTGNLVDFDLTVDEWQTTSWTSPASTYFYDELNKRDIKLNFYTNELTILTGGNPPESLLSGKINNFNQDPLKREVDRKALTKGMIKMSAYRLSPKIIKNRFYAQPSDYQDVVTVCEHQINHENYDFKRDFDKNGISLTDYKGLLTVQHLMGTHVFENDIFGQQKEDASPEETAIGCLYVVSNYLDEMKKKGLYDSATIIITADHGSAYGQVPIFMIKEPGAKNDEILLNTAPISHMDFLATIAQAAGIDPTPIGPTIYDFEPGELRERSFYLRDMRDDYPEVPCYTGDKSGGSNVYLKFTYTGTEDNLKELFWEGYNDIIPMTDCYY